MDWISERLAGPMLGVYGRLILAAAIGTSTAVWTIQGGFSVANGIGVVATVILVLSARGRLLTIRAARR